MGTLHYSICTYQRNRLLMMAGEGQRTAGPC